MCWTVDSEEAVRSTCLADIGAKPMVSVQLEEQVDAVQLDEQGDAVKLEK